MQLQQLYMLLLFKNVSFRIFFRGALEPKKQGCCLRCGFIATCCNVMQENPRSGEQEVHGSAVAAMLKVLIRNQKALPKRASAYDPII